MKNITRKSIARECAYIALAVALVTVSAWISVPVGAVPVTLQTFAVCFIGGYIFGFFFAALMPALAKLIPVKRKAARCALFYAANILGLAVCYLFGTVWFVLMYQCTVGYALALCVLPFLLPDAVKLLVAALLAVRLERYI